MNAITSSRRIDQPEPGHFRLRMVSKGPWVAGRITCALGLWSATINGQSCGPAHPDPAHAPGIERIWTSGQPIAAAAYDALLAYPPATPDSPINLGAMAPVEFQEPPMSASLRLNTPAIDLAAALEPGALAIWIGDQLSAQTDRARELTAANTRFLAATATGITSDATAERASDFDRQLADAIKATDKVRVEIKAPVLAAQRAIDGAAKAITDPLTAAGTECKRRITIFLVAKDREARRIAAEVAARAEEAAYQLSQQAGETGDAETFDEAESVLGEQQAAEAILYAPTAELTRFRTANGSSTSLRDNWTYTIEDIAKVPGHLLMINDAAVKLQIKAGARHIPGLTIRNDQRAGIR